MKRSLVGPFVTRHSLMLHVCTLFVTTLAALTTAPALAAGSDMPWEAPLETILDSIQGPVARIVGVGPERAVENVAIGVRPVERAVPRHEGGKQAKPPGRPRCQARGATIRPRWSAGQEV